MGKKYLYLYLYGSIQLYVSCLNLIAGLKSTSRMGGFGFSVCRILRPRFSSFIYLFFLPFTRLKRDRFYCSEIIFTVYILFSHCLCTVTILFTHLKILKMDSTVLFSHLKIILLQYFQFLISVTISSIQTNSI